MPTLNSSSDDDEVPLAQRAAAVGVASKPPSHAHERPMTTGEEGSGAPSAQRPTTTTTTTGPPVSAGLAGKPVGTANGRPRDDDSSDDDDVPLAQRAKMATGGANAGGATTPRANSVVPARPTPPPAAVRPTGMQAPAARPPVVVARPPIVTPKPPIGGFKMSKRPVAMPAKQSSRLDSSSDDEAAPPPRPTGVSSSSRELDERARMKMKLKKLKEEKRMKEYKMLKEKKRSRPDGERAPAPKPKKKPLRSEQPYTMKKGAVVMWKTLEHNGVVFPPDYEPHGVPLTYDGQDVKLLPHEEEIAGFFAVMKDTDYALKPVFVKNFMDGFRAALRNGPHAFITDFKKCDFTKMYNHFAKIREEKKAMTTEEKKAIKAAKDKAEEKYTWAVIDGRKEKVGNFRIEPPGLFRGRGEHPKMGKIKRRVMPEDITINIGRDAQVPPPPAGHQWKAVIHNDTATWLAGWNDVINVKDWKYVQFGATSSIKAESDQKKYEKARSLHKYIDRIRSDYKRNMASDSKEMAQLAVTTYLVDKLALRAGGEKDEDLADTVGVCTLRAGHIKFMDDNVIEFDFLGKDSIQYLQQHKIDETAYKCLQRFVRGKGPDVDIFDEINPQKVNAHLQTLMAGLTIKVFRTYNASITLDRLLQDTNDKNTTLQKKATYDAANKEVAILCNHQKGVSKAHDTQMEKLATKKKDLAKQITAMKKSDDKNKKKKLAALKERQAKLEIQMNMKEELKTVSLGTSKINYLDPRITISWCKRHEVPPPTVFTKALIEKFHWAMDCEMDFRFCNMDDVKTEI